MEVLVLTLFLSLLLAALFIACFVRDHRQRQRGAGPEQAALMPLEDDAPPEPPDREGKPSS